MRVSSGFLQVRKSPEHAPLSRIGVVYEGNGLYKDAKVHWDKQSGAFHYNYLITVSQLEEPDPSFATKRIVAVDPGCFLF